MKRRRAYGISLWKSYGLQNPIPQVFVTKYRYKVLKGYVGLNVRELIRQTCEAFVEKSSKELLVRIMSIFLSLRRLSLRLARS